MDSNQLLNYIIRPTLSKMGDQYDTKGADILLLATAAQESNCAEYVHQIGGPALGYLQIEPYTHWLVWNWATKNAPEQVPNVQPDDRRLVMNFGYSTVIARLLYASWGISPVDDGADNVYQAYEMWDRYKRRYNSYKGAATLDQFKRNWNDYVEPVL